MKKVYNNMRILPIITLVLVLLLTLNSCKNENVIKNVRDLQQIKTTYEKKNKYVLTNDLDLGSIEWCPLEPFYGTLDGKGHTIKNLKITSGELGGLFSKVLGTVKNLNVEVTIETSYSGGIAGKLENGGTIENCKVYGKLGNIYSIYVGGICGTVINSTIINCTNYAEITGNDTIGGIAGYSWSKYANTTIENCFNEGKVTGNNRIGGIVGVALADAEVVLNDPTTLGDTFTYVKGCSNNGIIKANENSVGGIIGYAEGTPSEKHNITTEEYEYGNGYINIVNSTNTSTITGANNVGGILGNGIKWISLFDKCINMGTITGNDYVGGIAGRNRSRQITNAKNSGIIKGNSYVGGIAGTTSSAAYCTNEGSVDGAKNLGGIIGYHFGETSTTNCENRGAVTGTSTYVGGIIGYAKSKAANVENCNNYGKISSAQGNRVGGILGYSATMEIINCHDYSEE